MSDWDITLGDQQYMLVPGSYRTSIDNGASPPQRIRINGFAGGLGQVGAEGGLLSGLGAWPAPWPVGAAGVGPGPMAQAVSGSVGSAEPKLAASDTEYLYIVAGSTIYRWDRALGTAPVNRKILPAAATCLVRLNDTLLIGHGSAADIARYDDATGTLTTSALGSGIAASMLATFSRSVVLVAPGFPMNLHIYYGNSLSYHRVWQLDGRILAMTQHGDALIVATDAGLHRLTGTWNQDTDPPAPDESLRLTSWGTLSGQLQDADDFAWMTVYQGRLMAWLGKRVVIYDEARGWWRQAGPEGASTAGAAVVNGWLLTTITPHASATTHQLWGYDGSGWWLLDEIMGASTLDAPTSDGGGRLVTFQSGGGDMRAYDLDDTTTASTLASPFTLTTPPIDAGTPDRSKTWRRVGMELTRPDGATVGEWTYAIDYSTDGGGTWTSAGAAASVSSAQASIEYAINASGTTLLLRVTGTRVSGLPPFIRAIWVAYDARDTARRRWQFRIMARERGINRTGALDTRSAQDIRDALWALRDVTPPVTFTDIDATSHTIHLTTIREDCPKPADHATGVGTVVEVVVEEE
jgi:hypothetical protein